MNWLGKMIGLPDEFLHKQNIDGETKSSSGGGGAIQTSKFE